MATRLDEQLTRKLQECKVMVASGVAFSAIARLGEVLALSEIAYEPHDERRGICAHEITALMTPELLDSATREALEVWRKVMRILSIGSTYNSDEVLLLVTLRAQLEYAVPAFRLAGIDVTPLDLGAVDAELRSLGRSRQHRSSFVSALQAVQKNWSVQIQDRWTS